MDGVFLILMLLQIITMLSIECMKRIVADRLFEMSKGKRKKEDTIKAANKTMWIPVFAQIKALLFMIIMFLPPLDELR